MTQEYPTTRNLRRLRRFAFALAPRAMIAVDVARDRRANATRCRTRRARTSSLIRRPPALALALALALAPRAPPRGAPRASSPAYPCARDRRPSRVSPLVRTRANRVGVTTRPQSRRARRARRESRFERTSGRNALKPSNKSSWPARHARTLSTTTSAVNLRRARASITGREWSTIVRASFARRHRLARAPRTSPA